MFVLRNFEVEVALASLNVVW